MLIQDITPVRTPKRVQHKKFEQPEKCIRCGLKSPVKGRRVCHRCRTHDWKVSKGEVLPPDYKDVTTEPYKEPLRQVKDGFGYYGAVVSTKTGSHVQCHICGFFYRGLSHHIAQFHKMNTKDYRVNYGLRMRDGLLSAQEKQRRQAMVMKNPNWRQQNKKALAAAHAATRRRVKKGKHKQGGNTWTLQKRNERGNCPDQCIAKIQELAKREGYASYNEFERTYGSGLMVSVKYHFKSWSNACKIAKVVTHAEFEKRDYEKRKQVVLNQIKDFYKKNGRTPQSADFNTSKEMPNQTTVSKMFGTLNRAREEAGVPLLVKRGAYRFEEVPHPSALVNAVRVVKAHVVK